MFTYEVAGLMQERGVLGRPERTKMIQKYGMGERKKV